MSSWRSRSQKALRECLLEFMASDCENFALFALQNPSVSEWFKSSVVCTLLRRLNGVSLLCRRFDIEKPESTRNTKTTKTEQIRLWTFKDQKRRRKISFVVGLRLKGWWKQIQKSEHRIIVPETTLDTNKGSRIRISSFSVLLSTTQTCAEEKQ